MTICRVRRGVGNIKAKVCGIFPTDKKRYSYSANQSEQHPMYAKEDE